MIISKDVNPQCQEIKDQLECDAWGKKTINFQGKAVLKLLELEKLPAHKKLICS